MNRPFKMILFVVILSLCLFKVLWNYNENSNRKFIEKMTSIRIPSNSFSIKYHLYEMVYENKYPYILLVKFETSKEDYLAMVKDILISRLDSGNIIYKRTFGYVITNDDYFWEFEKWKNIKYPKWWDVKQQLDNSLLFANIFAEYPIRHIGDTTNYSGKIVSYYDSTYCYMYVKCWAPR